jgi:hypothetical protein
MINLSYSASEIVTDGPLTCRRDIHHLINALIGLAVYAIVLALLQNAHRVTFGQLVAVGPSILLVSRIKEWIRPTDPHSYSAILHLEDALTDGACYCASLPLALLGWRSASSAVVAFVILCIVYFTFRHGARP